MRYSVGTICSVCVILAILVAGFTGCVEKIPEESDSDSISSEDAISVNEMRFGNETFTDFEEGCVESPIKLTSCPPEPEPLKLEHLEP